jgi:hypothetical protein
MFKPGLAELLLQTQNDGRVYLQLESQSTNFAQGQNPDPEIYRPPYRQLA